MDQSEGTYATSTGASITLTIDRRGFARRIFTLGNHAVIITITVLY